MNVALGFVKLAEMKWTKKRKRERECWLDLWVVSFRLGLVLVRCGCLEKGLVECVVLLCGSDDERRVSTRLLVQVNVIVNVSTSVTGSLRCSCW